MADDNVAQASVVAVPQSASPHRSPTPPTPDAHTTTKRRQSSTASHSSPKRQRLSPSPHPPTNQDHAQPTRSRRPANPLDEKKRTQRLFGGLLGGLGQSRPAANSPAAKRRAEQEDRRRQKEQELSDRQTERLALLNLARKKEQHRLDEANMRIRHDNMKAMAAFLTTDAEPKLYYRPWVLLPEQDDHIARQRDDTELLIDQELDDFDQVRKSWQNDYRHGHAHQPHRESTSQARATHDASELRSDLAPAHEQVSNMLPDSEPASAPAPVPTTTHASNDQKTAQDQLDQDAQRQRKESIDDTGDIVVEADEDTVIY